MTPAAANKADVRWTTVMGAAAIAMDIVTDHRYKRAPQPWAARGAGRLISRPLALALHRSLLHEIAKS